MGQEEFGFAHVIFTMNTRYPNGDVQSAFVVQVCSLRDSSDLGA